MNVTIFALVLFMTSTAYAQWRPFETIDESRQRKSADNWEVYKKRGYQAPLGGYPEKLGDPAPYGTERPGYVTPKGYGADQGRYPNGRGADQRGYRWKKR